ncbi:MAG TPA: ABC transporter permease [Geminicoccaceae bacterium]|nr:ABC transporter permease [Geminicoccaceae bacterium]
MAERPGGTAPVLEIRGLNVYYGHSHALQGVDLTLDHGGLAVVGRNGMGKTTLCQTIVGLQPAAGGSIRFAGQSILGLGPAEITRLGIGYVPQGRRLWPSLTVDEHLRLAASLRPGAWSVERIYTAFPRLAERRTSRGGQLSGGEQQMLAISRALLLNPTLLVMDEPTEGLAPLIVEQVEQILLDLEDEGHISVLLIEQNIGVATAVAESVAIIVNGRINRVMDARQIAGDRDLQQRLLGVGRHGHDDGEALGERTGEVEAEAPGSRHGPARIYISNPQIPTRWTPPVPAERIERAARTASTLPGALPRTAAPTEMRPLATFGERVVLVAGTLDTKGPELRFIRDRIKGAGLRTRLLDLSTTGKASAADIPAHQIAIYHPQGPSAVFTSDRGRSVAGMAVAFEAWIERQSEIAGIIAAGGSGGTAMAAPAMRRLPIGVPKVLISTVASGDVRRYVRASDIMMLHSVADVQGLNAITRSVLANGAEAMIGMVKARAESGRKTGAAEAAGPDLPAVGLTMFGVTTPCVQQVTAALAGDFDCLVFHATGIGGQAMEKLVESGMLEGVIDLTTTEVCDLLMGGVFPATEDRFGAMIRARTPYIGSCGALDMVNFGPPDTVPERYRGRTFYEHNPQVTLMRTTPEENRQIGYWIGAKLNQMDAPVRFLLPEGGVSALDAPGQPFHDPAADAALFAALEETVRQTSTRRLIRLQGHINEPAFAAAAVEAFSALHGGRPRQQRAGA